MQLDALIELRKQIAQNAQELALNGAGSVEERVSVLMGIIRASEPDRAVYARVYEMIRQVDDNDAQMGYLLDLLYEIDAKISEKTPSQDEIDQGEVEDNKE